ncbi:hypothetical protein BDV96DRAFT_601524 [Lophiotrema nucula]|uniref:MARVEL domain-containing protein n=1 Tax=Lophiotrema nucula TaxID=690887 RepID=A0A6A5Z4K9_9PLEO|nr:hypothetical protein BDV96DRAFT_601524 [Lophiotrema nucula]
MADRKASMKIPVHKKMDMHHADDPVVATPPTYPKVITLHDHIKKNQEPEVSPISPSQYTESAYPPVSRSYPAPQVYPIHPPSPTKPGQVLQHMPTRYAWHSSRIFLRGVSLLLIMLCVFLTIGFGAEQACGLEFSCEWTVTMATVAPAILLWNTVDLLTASVNGRGIHPSAHLPLDLLLLVGLVVGGVYDVYGGAYHQKKTAVGTIECVGGVCHAALLVLDIVAVVRLRRERRMGGRGWA